MMRSPLPTDLSASDLAVSTRSLSKRFKSVQALDDLALQVPAGAVYLLVGANGAGKSTTIKILLDLLRPTSGTAEVLGLDPQRQAAQVRANVGYVPEQLDWGYAWMRVGRLLEHHASYFPNWDAAYAKRLFQAFDLRLDQKMGTLSKGQGRRVHLAMALAHRPPMLILDEPTDGLDPVMRDEAIGVLIDHLADTPTTMLLCTHHVSEFDQFADHIGMLKDGRLLAQLPLEALHRGLRRYTAEIPAGWQGGALLGAAALRRSTTERELDWTVWGEESEVIGTLQASGATVRESATLSLGHATLALLTSRGLGASGRGAAGSHDATTESLNTLETVS
jgi:ABC-2 type transport system ATP-binding protein